MTAPPYGRPGHLTGLAALYRGGLVTNPIRYVDAVHAGFVCGVIAEARIALAQSRRGHPYAASVIEWCTRHPVAAGHAEPHPITVRRQALSEAAARHAEGVPW